MNVTALFYVRANKKQLFIFELKVEQTNFVYITQYLFPEKNLLAVHFGLTHYQLSNR